MKKQKLRTATGELRSPMACYNIYEKAHYNKPCNHATKFGLKANCPAHRRGALTHGAGYRMAGNRQHKPLTTSVGSILSLVGDRIHVVARAAMRHGRRGFSIVTTRGKRPDAGNETVKNHYR